MLKFSYIDDQDFLVYCATEFIAKFKGQDTFLLPDSDDKRLYRKNFPNTALLSIKQNVAYRIERYLNTIFINVDILYPNEIRKMPDSFWSLIVQLADIGKLEFIPSSINEHIKSKKNQKASNSTIYDLIKELVLIDEYDDFSVDFGSLQLEFDLSKEDKTLVDKIVNALTILHKVNYQLYRRNYLSTRK